MDQATFPFTLTDPFGHEFDCEYVFDFGWDDEPTSCALYVHDVCIDGEVDDYMAIWKAIKAHEKTQSGEDQAWQRRAA